MSMVGYAPWLRIDHIDRGYPLIPQSLFLLLLLLLLHRHYVTTPSMACAAGPAEGLVKGQHAAQALALVQQVEALIDLIKLEPAGADRWVGREA